MQSSLQMRLLVVNCTMLNNHHRAHRMRMLSAIFVLLCIFFIEKKLYQVFHPCTTSNCEHILVTQHIIWFAAICTHRSIVLVFVVFSKTITIKSSYISFCVGFSGISCVFRAMLPACSVNDLNPSLRHECVPWRAHHYVCLEWVHRDGASTLSGPADIRHHARLGGNTLWQEEHSHTSAVIRMVSPSVIKRIARLLASFHS